MNNLDNEIPKHHKKKPSSISKSNAKSKHKHEYKPCLLIHNERPHWATVCKICGKINNLRFFEVEKIKGQPYARQLDDDEVFEKYNDLKRYYIDDIRQRYISINKGKETIERKK